MIFWLLLALAIFFFLLSLHPFVLYPLSLYAIRKRHAARPAPASGASPASGFSFSICVCAYNEGQTIVGKAENMIAVAATVPDCALFIYVDGASDDTLERLEPYRDRINVVVGAARKGKSHGMNVLVDRCTSDLIVFSDANVELDMDALRRIAPHFADPRIGCVCGHLIYRNPDESAMSNSGSLYWRVEESIKQIESDAFSVIGADGSLFAIRRSAHHVVPDDIIDDFYVSMKILISGLRVVREPKAYAYENSATSTQDEFRRKIRIACQAFNVHRLIWPEVRKSPLLAYCYVSHRLLKWTIGFNLLASAIFFIAAMMLIFPPLAVLLTIAVLGAGFAALVALKVPLALRVQAILLSFLGAAIGVWRSIRGDRFQTWTPTPSARLTGKD